MNDQLEKCYFELAFTELAMDYYSLKERDKELEGEKGFERSNDIRFRLETLIKGCFEDFEGLSSLGSRAEELRAELKNKVEILVRKIDRLELEHYVEIRKEVPDEKPEYADDDDAARAVLRSIFGVNDNTLINERIRMAVYELPVRMTKVRFYDILKNSLKIYIGISSDVLARMMYMLYSTSGLKGDEEFAGEDITKADVSLLQEEYDYLNDLASICNYICVLGRVSDNIRNEGRKKVEDLLKLIEASSGLDEKSNADEAEKILSRLEGILEELSERRLVLEAKLESYLESGSRPDEEAVKLESMRRLMSSSVYAELEADSFGNADEKEVDSAFERFSEELDKAFKTGNRALNRARQAAVLSTLPVFFNSKADVMNYVRESLSACSNVHEKNTAVSKILSMEF
ncbi:MAG: hypothetical protein K6E47_11240 [Lachnospiraceae bacterium]|nr:hypothetical protein [Lachnospiraceae bacterium]